MQVFFFRVACFKQIVENFYTFLLDGLTVSSAKSHYHTVNVNTKKISLHLLESSNNRLALQNNNNKKFVLFVYNL